MSNQDKKADSPLKNEDKSEDGNLIQRVESLPSSSFEMIRRLRIGQNYLRNGLRSQPAGR